MRPGRDRRLCAEQSGGGQGYEQSGSVQNYMHDFRRPMISLQPQKRVEGIEPAERGPEGTPQPGAAAPLSKVNRRAISCGQVHGGFAYRVNFARAAASGNLLDPKVFNLARRVLCVCRHGKRTDQFNG